MAGTFGRGIPFINYATTLLAAADASVGGKTAVDTPLATNLIGLFNQPQKVYLDIATWKTLPQRQLASGMAETIKHACMASSDLWNAEAFIDTTVIPVILMFIINYFVLASKLKISPLRFLRRELSKKMRKKAVCVRS